MAYKFQPYGTKQRMIKWLPSVIILPICVYFVAYRGTFIFIDNIDMVIHEGGQVFFSYFGKFVYTYGATLMQIFIPALLVWYFFATNYRLGVQFSLLWLGQNFINISVYAADVRTQKLHLIGGENMYHEWNFMLSKLGLLQYDYQVGIFFVALAIIAFGLAVLMPLILQE
jgi:hypothetical protein